MFNTLYTHHFKYFFDLSMAFICLILLSPILITSIIMVKATSNGPAFFTQDRLGKHGSIFKLLKFRTMTHKPRKADDEVFSDNPEVTAVGKLLRRFKIDELPQLINILRGEMSFIGPRPALPQQLSEYDELSKTRLLVRPGLTGLAQVNGNIYLSWPERWKLDAEYVRAISPLCDLMILGKTVLVVIWGEKYFAKDN